MLASNHSTALRAGRRAPHRGVRVLVLGTANVCKSRGTHLNSARVGDAQHMHIVYDTRLQTALAAATTTLELEHAQREGVTMGGEGTSNQHREGFDSRIKFRHTCDMRKALMKKRWTQRNRNGPQLLVYTRLSHQGIPSLLQLLR
jgi:hypothetical protein